MGTPDFAVPSLDILLRAPYSVVGVVTSPDKPSGRGQKMKYSPVKEYALENNLPVFQPKNLKDPDFISQLYSLKANLFIVVAFRMLPAVVWQMPRLGTFNLHASLLPQYRGAAPINWAIINGEKVTGLTTFFIDEKIDTGKIIFTEKINIDQNKNAGDLHDRMMLKGALLVLQTVRAIENDSLNIVPQDSLIDQNLSLKPAPKIFREDCEIDWNKGLTDIYNFIRGLSPYPCSFTNLISPDGDTRIIKVYRAEKATGIRKTEFNVGSILTDNKSFLMIGCEDGFINIIEIQIEGKKRMNIEDFLKGFQISNAWNAGKISTF